VRESRETICLSIYICVSIGKQLQFENNNKPSDYMFQHLYLFKQMNAITIYE